MGTSVNTHHRWTPGLAVMILPLVGAVAWLNLDAVALVGSLCTALKLWLSLSWIPVFAVGIVLTVAEKLRRPAGAA